MKARIAFCFHDPEPSGASLWLKSFLMKSWPDKENIFAILPGDSPITDDLHEEGIATAELRIKQGAVSLSRGLTKFSLLTNRLQAIADYRLLFLRERVSLVYVNSSVQLAPIIAARLARIPLVVHVHEGWRTGRGFGVKRFFIRRFSSGVIFAARSARRLFAPLPISTPWIVSPNGVDPGLTEVRDKRRAAVRQELGLHDKETVFLFLGTISRRKGFPDLAGCWKRFHQEHPDTRLLLAGNLDEPTLRGFKFITEGRLPAASYLGFREDVPGLLSAADFLVLPSYGEAMPLTVVEAMMVGTPVIARAVGDIPWLLEDDRGLLFHGGGKKPLMGSLRRAAEMSPEERGEIIHRAQEFARERLTREAQYNEIRGFLEKIRKEKG